MKLKNKIAAITAAAMLAFAGTGFAAWTFNTERATQSGAGAESAIACTVELNDNFKLRYNDADLDTIYLIFDAPSHSVNSHVIGGNGIYWSTTNDSTAYANKIEGNVLTIEGTMAYDKKNVDDLDSVTVTFADNGSSLEDTTYVDFGSVVIPAAVDIDIPANSNNSIAVSSAAFALPTVVYKDAIANIASASDVASVTTGVSVSLNYKAYISAQELK